MWFFIISLSISAHISKLAVTIVTSPGTRSLEVWALFPLQVWISLSTTSQAWAYFLTLLPGMPSLSGPDPGCLLLLLVTDVVLGTKVRRNPPPSPPLGKYVCKWGGEGVVTQETYKKLFRTIKECINYTLINCIKIYWFNKHLLSSY